MYRYDQYYGYWSSDESSDGGDWRYEPNVGDGGKDTGFSPAPPIPPPMPPPEPSSLIDTTPCVITLNEADSFNGSAAGYIPSGQFTESRAFPLYASRGSKDGVQKMVIVKNERPGYDLAPMENEIFRFPYYVPANADLSLLPMPSITWEASMANNLGGTTTGTVTFSAVNTVEPETEDVWSYETTDATRVSSDTRVFTLITDQMLTFTKGKFNDFLFRIKISNVEHLKRKNTGLQFLISNVKTNLPDGFEFEFKRMQNYNSYFNINVVNKDNRTLKGSVTSNTSVTIAPVTPPGNGWTLFNTWRRDNYDGANGYTHWEIPTSTFTGNFQFNWPIIMFPDNTQFCSMEKSFKQPGPQPPWNLISRHETFWFAPHQMRVSDYPQRISPVPIFYCPTRFHAVVWLKQGVAVNDVLT